MKFSAAKILLSITYPAILVSFFLLVFAKLTPEIAVWAFMIAPAIVSFFSIALLGGRYSSPSSRLAIAGAASTLIFCVLFPLTLSGYEEWRLGPGINFWPLLITTYIYLLILFTIPILVTTSAGIVAGLAYVARFGR